MQSQRNNTEAEIVTLFKQTTLYKKYFNHDILQIKLQRITMSSDPKLISSAYIDLYRLIRQCLVVVMDLVGIDIINEIDRNSDRSVIAIPPSEFAIDPTYEIIKFEFLNVEKIRREIATDSKNSLPVKDKLTLFILESFYLFDMLQNPLDAMPRSAPIKPVRFKSFEAFAFAFCPTVKLYQENDSDIHALQRSLGYLTEYYNTNVILQEFTKIQEADVGHALILMNEFYRKLQITIAFLMSHFEQLNITSLKELKSFEGLPDYILFTGIKLDGKNIEENGSKARNFILRKGEDNLNAAKQILLKYINISNMQQMTIKYKQNADIDVFHRVTTAIICAKQVNKIVGEFLNTPHIAKDSYPFTMLQSIKLIEFFNDGKIINELIAIKAIEDAEKNTSAPTHDLLLINLYESIADGLYHIMKELNALTHNLIIPNVLMLANFDSTGIPKDILTQKSKYGEQNPFLNNAKMIQLTNSITHPQQYRILFVYFTQCVFLADLFNTATHILKKQCPHDTIIFSSVQEFSEVFLPGMLSANIVAKYVESKTESPAGKPLKITEVSPALTQKGNYENLYTFTEHRIKAVKIDLDQIKSHKKKARANYETIIAEHTASYENILKAFNAVPITKVDYDVWSQKLRAIITDANSLIDELDDLNKTILDIVQWLQRHEQHASSSSSAVEKWTPKSKQPKPIVEEKSVKKIARSFPVKPAPQAAKPNEEKKLAATALTVAFKPDVIENIQENTKLKYLDEACKNLIFIRKITSVEYGENLSKDVKYYALLYHIFRCFEALKRYQECGGSKQKFNQNEVANLRLMIMHRGGALAADEASVFEFANTLKTELTTTLLSLIQKNKMESELTEAQRKEIFVEFGLIDNNDSLKIRGVHHIALEIQQTPLYINLKNFHEVGILKHKYNDREMVERKYLPLINTILPSLTKVSWSDENTFLPAYLIHIHALRMLVTICGEFGNYKSHKWNEFLKYCREQRTQVGHNVVDLKKPMEFLRQLAGKVGFVVSNSNPRMFAKAVAALAKGQEDYKSPAP